MPENVININKWIIAIILYLLAASLTLIPIIKAIFKKIKLNPGGASFKQSLNFSKEFSEKLEQHYSRIQGTLVFWKNKAELYKFLHYYCLLWTIPISIVIPIAIQYIDGSSEGKTFLTIISAHSAIILALHKGLKVENNYKAFRNGESEFYDLYREFLDMPYKFGKNEQEMLDAYFTQVQIIRKYVRNAEIDNFPSIEDIKPIIEDGKNNGE